MNLKKLLFLVFAFAIISSCSKDDPIELIEQYISDNNLDVQITDEGLYYIIENEGTGKRPSETDNVKVHYRGELLNGTPFDANQGTPKAQVTPFNLQGVIPGWTIGIPLFKEGGNGLLIIPPDLAYGNNPPPGSIIGNNEVLVFEVELLEVL